MSMLRVVAAQAVPDNLNLFEFHSVTKLTEFVREDWSLNGIPDDEAYCAPLARLILEVNGVTWLRVQPYSIYVQKGTLFSWDDIAPRVISMLLLWHETQAVLNGIPVEHRIVEKDPGDGPVAYEGNVNAGV